MMSTQLSSHSFLIKSPIPSIRDRIFLVYLFHEASLQDESLDLRRVRTDLLDVVGEADIFDLYSFFEGDLSSLHIELLSELDSVA
jgi:hypothetical protein